MPTAATSRHPAGTGRVEVDLLVIGAGPAGLYAAYYAGFRDMSVAVLDALPEPGGQITAMYPEKVIYDVAGFPSVTGRDLVAGLLAQADTFGPRYLLGTRAETLTVDQDGVEVGTEDGSSVRARAVVITGGIGSFAPRPLPAGAHFEQRGLQYFVPRPQELADRDVLVVGGGDSACDWALTLEPLVRSVTLAHRRCDFRAHESSVSRLHASSVRVLTPYEVVRVHGDGWVSGVELGHADAQTHAPADAQAHAPADAHAHAQAQLRPVHVQVQAIVAALGFVADLGPLRRWGLELNKARILVDTQMRTNLSRVFAAGDIVDYPGKVRLISVGFGEAATAVNNAAALVRPGASVHPGHSSALPSAR